MQITKGFIGRHSFINGTVAANKTRQWLQYIAEKSDNVRVVHSSDVLTLLSCGGGSCDTYEDESLVVVCLGEIYRSRNSGNVSIPGSGAGVSPCAKLAARAYQSHDTKGIFATEGIFSMVLFDKKRQRLLLFKDDSSFRFLYYRNDPVSGIVFSTDLDLLLSHPHMERRISHEALHEYLRTYMIYPPLTIYEGIRSVMPGCVIEYTKSGLRLIEAPLKKRLEPPELSFPQCVDRLNELLKSAVAMRLDRSNDSAFFLSGGMDSSLLCCVGKNIIGNKLSAFTIGYENSPYDECDRASQLADYLKINHHRLILKEENYLEHFLNMTRLSDQPFADPSGTPTFYAFDLVKKHTDTIIDGTGSDSLVGTMPPRYKRVATQYASLLPIKMRRQIRNLILLSKKYGKYEDLFDFEEPLDLLIMWKSWRKSEIEALCGEKVHLENNILYKIYQRYPRSAHYERYSEMYRYASDDRIHQAGRVFDVAVRFPYWDREVQDFVGSLKREYRFLEGEPKRIIRAALESHVPKDLLRVKRQGFIFPMETFMLQNDSELIHRYLNRQSLSVHNLFDNSLVESTIKAFQAGDRSKKFRVWSLVVFQAWYENHFMNVRTR